MSWSTYDHWKATEPDYDEERPEEPMTFYLCRYGHQTPVDDGTDAPCRVCGNTDKCGFDDKALGYYETPQYYYESEARREARIMASGLVSDEAREYMLEVVSCSERLGEDGMCDCARVHLASIAKLETENKMLLSGSAEAAVVRQSRISKLEGESRMLESSLKLSLEISKRQLETTKALRQKVVEFITEHDTWTCGRIDSCTEFQALRSTAPEANSDE